MWKTSRFQTNPTWYILRHGLKTIWGNFQTAASDSYFWKKQNDWVSLKTMTTNLDRNHMAYPTLFHAVSTQCLVLVFLPLVCFLLLFFQGNSQFYEEDTLLWIGPRYNVWPLFCLNNMNWKLCVCVYIYIYIHTNMFGWRPWIVSFSKSLSEDIWVFLLFFFMGESRL